MLARVLVSLFFVPVSVSLVACSGGAGSSDPSGGTSDDSLATSTATSGDAAGVDAFCTTACGRSSTCGASIELQTCILDCENGEQATLGRSRSDVVADIDTCVKNASCSDVLGGDFVGTCVDTALAEVAPSATAASFCKAYGAAQTTCGLSVDQGSCLGFAKPYADSFLAQATSCAKSACSDIDDCVSAVLDIPVDSDDGDGGS